ncbi:Endoplasmic reticulum vesicle transporter protein [Zea mays]|uniref:Endoplasmic reticulum vesicle transporter protein n=1 Tax=Zea mays TaxID=4577 RepID=A0A1D6M730_MAIZE|nr:Endoplasmic reticulum vesicle transporter protein [Zea mays]
MDAFLQRLKRLDAYPKVNEDFYKRTLSGGIVTLVAAVVMLLLFISETIAFGFSSYGCHNLRHDIEKIRLDAHGNVIEARKVSIGGAKIERPLQKHGGRLDKGEQYCGTCYGAEESDEQCCNSCEEVREAYKKKGWALTNPDLIDQCAREDFVERVKTQQDEGCNVHGFLDVSKVAGNFHFAPGKGFYESNIDVPELSLLEGGFNITHKINKLSFGTEFPGVVNPLDGAQWTQPASDGTYQYFIKVVPTIYTDIRGHNIHSNQFSVTEHFRDGNVRPKPQPGVFFFYDFSPIKVIFTEESRSLLHYLTNLCAIVGGVFTVSGIIDSFIYHGQKALKKKMELGKYR